MIKLRDKQEKFVQEYLIDFNASQAAIRAGYSEKTSRAIGSELLTNPNIQERIKELQSQTVQKLNITKDEILINLKTIMDMHLMNDNPNAALKAIEILNKMLGLNEPDKQELTHKGIIINYIKPIDGNENDNQL